MWINRILIKTVDDKSPNSGKKYPVPGLFQKDFCVIIMYVYCAYKLHDLVTFPSMYLMMKSIIFDTCHCVIYNMGALETIICNIQ